jgi:hypothetical protein
MIRLQILTAKDGSKTGYYYSGGSKTNRAAAPCPAAAQDFPRKKELP